MAFKTYKPVYTGPLTREQVEQSVRLVETLRSETVPWEGHTDLGAIFDCWNSLQEIVSLMAKELAPKQCPQLKTGDRIKWQRLEDNQLIECSGQVVSTKPLGMNEAVYRVEGTYTISKEPVEDFLNSTDETIEVVDKSILVSEFTATGEDPLKAGYFRYIFWTNKPLPKPDCMIPGVYWNTEIQKAINRRL